MMEEVARFMLQVREARHIRAVMAEEKAAALANDGSDRIPHSCGTAKRTVPHDRDSLCRLNQLTIKV